APTLGPARGGDGAGVEFTGGDRRDAAGEAGDVDRRRTPGGRPVAELAVAVVAPALHPARGGEGAGVDEAGGDGRDPAGEAGGIDGGGAIRGRPVAELAVAVVAPALRPAGGGHGTRVERAGGDGRCGCSVGRAGQDRACSGHEER